MQVYNGLGSEGVNAINGWFVGGSSVGGGTHMRVAFVSNYGDSQLRLQETSSNPCNIPFATACWRPTAFTYDSGRRVYHWWHSQVLVRPLSEFKDASHRTGSIAHEIGHALGLDHQNTHQVGSCHKLDGNYNIIPSFHSIMEGSQLVNGKIERCDTSAMLPQTTDFVLVKRLYGYSTDTSQTNPYFGIYKDSSGVLYRYYDHRMADPFTLLEYYWSNDCCSGFDPFASEIMQQQPGGYYLYNNGTNDNIDVTRVLEQRFNPSNWGINNKFISVCVYGYYNSSTISSNKTRSMYSIKWP